MNHRLLAGMALGCALTPLAAPAADINTFIASMTPSQEAAAPTVSSNPSCIATFTHEPAGGKINYKIRCTSITGVTGAHIHTGNADTASGPIAVGVFGGPTTGAVEGILTTGTILRTSLGDSAFNTLLANMRSDGVYVNVHTTVNGGGEVRGQIVALPVPKVTTLTY
jgi:hypothetical protein